MHPHPLEPGHRHQASVEVDLPIAPVGGAAEGEDRHLLIADGDETLAVVAAERLVDQAKAAFRQALVELGEALRRGRPIARADRGTRRLLGERQIGVLRELGHQDGGAVGIGGAPGGGERDLVGRQMAVAAARQRERLRPWANVTLRAALESFSARDR